MRDVFREVVGVALPLMISTGMFSLVLFADRTFLLWHEPAQMGAAMAAGNLFWVVICVFVGINSMTGAIASQYVGAKQPHQIGRLMWQSVWFAIATMPIFIVAGFFGEDLFRATGQAESLIDMEATYFQILLWGGAAEVMQTGLSGFFSGIHRTRIIMVVSVISGLLNLLLDLVLIFGVDPAWWGGEGPRVLELGIAGAAIASAISFWFKAVVYGALICRPRFRDAYGIMSGIAIDGPMLRKLVYFGFPAGLMYVTEAGGFTVIVLMIGRLGDIPLQATTMAINFNMIAFIPLVGMSIAVSVLVGQRLVENGPDAAMKRVWAGLTIGWVYSAIWALIYFFAADAMIAFYSLDPNSADSQAAGGIAEVMLGIVAIYVVLDATQLILAGALRGAGDTWFVLLAGLSVSTVVIVVGLLAEPVMSKTLASTSSIWGGPSKLQPPALRWWWWVLTAWVFGLAMAMLGRFWQGKWKKMRMV